MKLIRVLMFLLMIATALILICEQVPAANEASGQEAAKRFSQSRQELPRLWQEKQYQQAVQLLEQLLQVPGMQDSEQFRGQLSYDLACTYAKMGERDNAFTYLKQAVASGLLTSDFIRQDPDIAAIRDDVRFAQIIVQLESAEKLCEGAALATPYRENISEDEKVAGLSLFWSEVKYNFAYFERIPDVDWNALYLAYLPKVRATQSTLDYYRVLQELCAKLRDTHTGVNLPAELRDIAEARPAITTELVGGRVLITDVLDDALVKDGAKPGLEIVAIDGIPTHEYAEQRVFPYLSVSSPQTRDDWGFGWKLLFGSKDQPVELTLSDSTGRIFTRKLPRVSPARRKERPRKLFEFRMEGNIAYVTFRDFSDEAALGEFDSSFPKIEEAAALVIDVRRNGGGSSHIGWGILGYLTDKPFATHRALRRRYDPYGRARGWSPWAIEASKADPRPPQGTKLFAKPVVVLTSAQTGSAAEDFCLAFDAMQRGKIVGEPTCGSTGQPLYFKLPGGGSARVCTIKTTYPDGKEFVSSGIQPDILVHPTVADVRAGRDTVLQAALEYLRAESSAEARQAD